MQRQFERRAVHWAQHDAVVREVERRLVGRLDLMRIAPARMLDVGCGPGHSRRLLCERFSAAEWLGVDRSRAMFGTALRGWRRWLPAARGARPLFVQADAAALPLADASVELVLSNLMLHWYPDPAAALAEWLRVLRPGGLLLFSCLGPDSLRQVRAAFAAHWPAARPLTYADLHDVGDALVATGGADPVLEAEHLTLTYASPAALLREVAALGGNPHPQRPAGLPGTRRARAVRAALPSDGGGRWPLTLEVVYGHAWRVARRDRAAAVPLAQLRATLPARRG